MALDLYFPCGPRRGFEGRKTALSIWVWHVVVAQLINAKCMNASLSPIWRCLSLHLLSSLGLSTLSSTGLFFFFGCAGSMLLYLGFLCGDRGLLFVAVIRLLKDGSSCCRAWALGAQASVVAAHRGSAALQHLPGPGIEPKYPASPGKSQAQAFGSSL